MIYDFTCQRWTLFSDFLYRKQMTIFTENEPIIKEIEKKLLSDVNDLDVYSQFLLNRDSLNLT